MSSASSGNNNNHLAAREFASAVLSGTVIGRSLQDALYSLSQEDEKDQSIQPPGDDNDDDGDDDEEIDDDNDDDDDDDDDQQQTTTSSQKKKDNKKNHVRMDAHSMDKIVKSFGDAVAESSRIIGSSSPAECEAEADQQQQDLLAVAPPRALLKGRCKHYNKFGQNWMVSIDQVRIKQRPIKFTKRRRYDRPSLWDRDNDDGIIATTTTAAAATTTTTTATTNKEKEIPVKEKIQLLAYGDIP